MKAVVQDTYGPPDVMELGEVDSSLAMAISASAASIPLTVAPRAAAISQNVPDAQPMSRTDLPAPIPVSCSITS